MKFCNPPGQIKYKIQYKSSQKRHELYFLYVYILPSQQNMYQAKYLCMHVYSSTYVKQAHTL